MEANTTYDNHERFVSLLVITTILFFALIYSLIYHQNNLSIEAINYIKQGLLAGTIGLWIKHLYYESAKLRETAKARLEANSQAMYKKHQLYQGMFLQLKDGCGEGNQTLHDRFAADDTASEWITTHDALQNLLM